MICWFYKTIGMVCALKSCSELNGLFNIQMNLHSNNVKLRIHCVEWLSFILSILSHTDEA